MEKSSLKCQQPVLRYEPFFFKKCVLLYLWSFCSIFYTSFNKKYNQKQTNDYHHIQVKLAPGPFMYNKILLTPTVRAPGGATLHFVVSFLKSLLSGRQEIWTIPAGLSKHIPLLNKTKEAIIRKRNLYMVRISLSTLQRKHFPIFTA